MGRGDKRTAKGKRFKGSYGNSRPHKETVVLAPKAATEKKAKAKKEKAEKPVKKAAAKKAPKKKAE
jgi:ribosomal small subunit protein bTHX